MAKPQPTSQFEEVGGKRNMENYYFAGIVALVEQRLWLSSLNESGIRITDWISAKYQESPALILGVGLALALPALAIIAAWVRMAVGISSSRSSADDIAEKTVRTIPISAWHQVAALEMTDNSRYPIEQSIVRIGRETDNDLCLSDPTVHRYHAVLERSPDAEYSIQYIGDPDSDGMLINGQVVQRQRLRGGEVLQIGAIKLRFAVSTA